MPVSMPGQGVFGDSAFSVGAETRREALTVALEQCQTHADVMALWSDALVRWNSPVTRARWNNREEVLRLEAARKASLANELAARSLSGR